MNNLKSFWLEFWHALGFYNMSDFLATFTGLKFGFAVVLQAFAGVALGYYGYIEKYIYSPGQAVIIMVVLILVDTILGAIVAVKHKGQRINLAKLGRMFPILIANIMVMSFSWHFKNIDADAYGWMPSATFGFLGVRNLLSVIRSCIRLRYLRADFLSFLNTKISADYIDDQEDKTKGAATIVILALAFVGSSCVTYDRCQKKFGAGRDTLYLTIHDTTIIRTTGDSAAIGFTDSTLDAMAVGDVFEFENPPSVSPQLAPDKTTIATPVKVRIRKTGKGKYQAEAVVKPQTRYITKTITKACPPCPDIEMPERIKWKWFGMGALAAILLALLFRKITR